MQEEVKHLDTVGTVRAGGKIRPQEPVDIYALKSKSGAHLGEPGTKHTVHAVLAHKLVAKGAATLTAPKKEAAVKPTAKQLKAISEKLTNELGREPEDDEIEAAFEAQKGGSE